MLEKLVGGEWSGTGDRMEILDPATGMVVDEVVMGTVEDVHVAAKAAISAVARKEWRENPILRAQFLSKWADRIAHDQHNLARLLTRENGKVLNEAEREIGATVDTLRFAAGQARQLEGRSLTLSPGVYGDIIPEPLGVVGFIIPWNWPVLLLMRELAPALAAGNAAVVKPSLLAPLTVVSLFQHLPDEPGIPDGLLSVIPGHGSDVGEALVQHPLVAAISFTGSTEVGQRITGLAAHSIKKVLLELGGKSASLVFADAPLDKVIPLLTQGAFGSSGQNCMAASRILVQDGIYDQVQEQLVRAASRIRVGPGLHATSTMGPLISEKQLEQTDEYVQAGVRDGGRILTGGERLTSGGLGQGHFYAPTIIGDALLSSGLVQDEIFGPVISLERFTDEDDGIELANGTRYGLTASIWTADHSRALRLSRRLEAGTVWINTYQRTFAEAESGGMKKSGLGRSRGRAGLYEYTELKHILSDVNS